MQYYQINNLSTNQEVESEIEMLIAELTELTYTGTESIGYFTRGFDTNRFIFLLDSAIARIILAHNPEISLELNLNDFEKGDLESLSPQTMREVYFHKEYTRKKSKFEHRFVHYETLASLSGAERNKIPSIFYEHLYQYFMEDDPLEDSYAFTNYFIQKKQVPRALANVTAKNIDEIKTLIIHNQDITFLRRIIEEGFRQKDFGSFKQGTDSEGNLINFFEKTLKNFSNQEQKILFCSIVKDKDTWQNKSVHLKCSEGFWHLFLFICASYNKENAIIHYGVNMFVEVGFGDLVLTFELIERQLCQINFNVYRPEIN